MTFVLRALTAKNTFVYVTTHTLPTLTEYPHGFWGHDVSLAYHFISEAEAQAFAAQVQAVRHIRTLAVTPVTEDTAADTWEDTLPTLTAQEACRDVERLAGHIQTVLRCSRDEAVSQATAWRVDGVWPVPGRNHTYPLGTVFAVLRGGLFLSNLFPITWEQHPACAWVCETLEDIQTIAAILTPHVSQKTHAILRPIPVEIHTTTIQKTQHGFLQMGRWTRVS